MQRRTEGIIEVRHFPTLGGLDFVRARESKLSVPRHTHASYCIGAIEAGVRQITIRGSQEFIPAGAVTIINPADVHTCTSDGHSYSVFCLRPDWVAQIAGKVTGKNRYPPYFPQAVLHDQILFDGLVNLSHILRKSSTGLKVEACLIELVSHLILRYSEFSPIGLGWTDSQDVVNRVRQWIDDCYEQDIGTNELSQIACLSPFHLTRLFTRRVGLPPHTYLTLARLRQARRLIREGMAIADAAVQVGFFDQSHFTNVFGKYVGMTPGQFAMCRDTHNNLRTT